ncbi:MAG: hypothetical protein HDR01_12115 [Lachnospiraceae bacterium]|nr:hypothetical protein [Lachnospiraceae bacterium]
MAVKDDYIVGGFEFPTEGEAKAAKNDENKIRAIDKKLNYNNFEAVSMVYNKAIENHVFETAIGEHYLKKLQEHLIEKKEADSDFVLKPIPLRSKLPVAKQSEETAKVKVRIGSKKESKQKLKFSIILNFFLALIIVILFIITLTGENANIINYRTVITNQYARWEQELQQREEAVREKEKELFSE